MSAVNRMSLGFEAAVATASDVATTWHEGCPVPIDHLARVRMNHLGFDGALHRGEMIVAARFVADVERIFARALAEEFPIRLMVNPNEFGADDDAMMEADNTSCFNFRVVAGTNRVSKHGLGEAVDINPRENPYLGPDGWVPPSGVPRYLDRSLDEPGMHHADGVFVREFLAMGGRWGADFDDLHHFEFVHPRGV